MKRMKQWISKVPALIKIDHLTYRVVFLREDCPEAQEYIGRHDSTNSEIRLHEGLTEEHARDVLLHEIVHAFLWKGGYSNLRRVEDVEEFICTIIPGAMIRLCRDNPELAKWLFTEARG